MDIRPERAGDLDAIRAIHHAAFETPDEATLVDRLRAQASPLISLVADEGGAIVAHILFSPATLADHPDARVMGLAPMAVLPSHQRRGIGSSLVRTGLDECRRLRADAVIVLGHAEYYPRFGFRRASAFGIRCEYDVPDEVFMAMALKAGALAGKGGLIRYHPVFAQ